MKCLRCGEPYGGAQVYVTEYGGCLKCSSGGRCNTCGKVLRGQRKKCDECKQKAKKVYLCDGCGVEIESPRRKCDHCLADSVRSARKRRYIRSVLRDQGIL